MFLTALLGASESQNRATELRRLHVECGMVGPGPVCL